MMKELAEAVGGEEMNNIWKWLFPVMLVILFLVSPFFNGSNSPEGKLIQESIIWVIIFFSFLIFTRKQELKLSLFPLELIAAVFLLFSLFSAFTAVYPVDAWLAVGRIFLVGCLFTITISAVKKKSRLINILFIAIIVSGVLQVLFCAHQFLFTQWYAVNYAGFFENNLRPNLRGGVLRTVGGFINPNYLAAFLNICIALAISYVLFQPGRKLFKILAGIASILLMAGVVLSGSKGGLIVLALTIGILVFIKEKKVIWLFLILLLLITVVPNPLKDQFVRAVTADPYISMRPGIWGSAVSLCLDKPITGVGPDNFRYMGHKHAPPTNFLLVNYSKFPRIAHNAILHSFAEYGIVGFMPLFFIIIYFLWKSITTILTKDRTGDYWAIAVGIATSFIGVSIHSIVDNVMNHKVIMLVMVVLLAIFSEILIKNKRAGVLLKERTSLKFPPVSRNVLTLCGSFLLLAFLHYEILKPYFYEVDMVAVAPEVKTIQEELANGGSLSEGKTVELKNRLLASSVKYPHNLTVWRNLANIEKAEFISNGEIHHYLNSLKYYQRADENLKGHGYSEAYAQLTLLFEMVNKGYPKTEEIITLMRNKARQAIAANPQRAIYYQAAATVEREAGKLGEARRLLIKASMLEPNYLQAWSDLALLAKAGEKEADFRRFEKQFKAAFERIKKGPQPEADDVYSRQIITPPY